MNLPVFTIRADLGTNPCRKGARKGARQGVRKGVRYLCFRKGVRTSARKAYEVFA